MKSGLERLLVEGHRWVGARRLGVLGPQAVSRALAAAGIRFVNADADDVDDDDVDTILVDLPASGSRLTGEHLVLLDLLLRSAERGHRVLVLDRPIPLGGLLLEGPTLDLRAAGLGRPVPLPLRHGLTMGELARWLMRMGGLRVDLDVVPCTGWDRLMGPHPPPPFRQPAWHLPALFCGLGVVAAAAEWTWTPGPDGRVALSRQGMDGARVLELARMGAVDADLHGVEFHAHANGLGIRLLEAHAVDSIQVGLVVLEALIREHQVRSNAPLWVTEDGTARIDRVSGSPELRLAMTARIRPTELAEAWGPVLTQFDEDRQAVLLY